MKTPPPSLWPSNPFSTRFVRPGQLPFIFTGDADVEKLVARLAENQWQGQIIGPHGVGKSTLLHTLIPAIESRGRSVILYTLSSQTDVPSFEARSADSSTQFLVDGFEQLSSRRQKALIRECRARGGGLLVTTHERQQDLPTILELEPTLASVTRVVQKLTRDGNVTISPSDVERLFAQHAPNVRELLFALYDIVEAQRRA